MSTEPERPRVMWRDFNINDDMPVWLHHDRPSGGKFPPVVIIPLADAGKIPSKKKLMAAQRLLTK